MERELRFRPHHLENEFWLVPLFCSKDKTALDIGTNMGLYSYFMAKYSKEVISFEPNVDLLDHLHRFLGRKAHIESIALSAKSSRALMRVDSSNTGVATIEEKNDLSCVEDKSAVESREVETRTLDSFGLSNVSLIKVDVEGHEEAVLEGARGTIQRNMPVLIIESEERHNAGALQRIVEMLTKLGYASFFLKDRQLLELSVLSRENLEPKKLGSGDSDYINNFIFIPANEAGLIEQAKQYQDSRQTV
jgi:FkbM family methyltransferase